MDTQAERWGQLLVATETKLSRRLWSQAEMKTGSRGRKMGGGGSLRVTAVLHSKLLRII